MTSNLRDIALRVCRGTSTSYITRLVITDNYTIIKDTFSIIVTLGVINSFFCHSFSYFFPLFLNAMTSSFPSRNVKVFKTLSIVGKKKKDDEILIRTRKN